MGKSYRPYHPNEELLLPPSLRDWLPENHLAYFVSDVVDNVDLSAMDAVYGNEKRGQPPYDPQMMTKVLGVQLLRGGVQFPPHRTPTGGRHRFPGSGGGQSAQFPHHLRFPEDPSEDAGRSVRASAEDRSGSRGNEDRPSGAGWQESKGQCQQAQGDELRPDAGEGKATQGGSKAIAGTGRGCRCGGRHPVREGHAG